MRLQTQYGFVNQLTVTCWVLFAVTAPCVAQQVVVPNSLASVEGNANSGFPFNLDSFSLTSQRYQEVFAASEFAALTGLADITQIAFRPDASFGAAFSSTLPDIQIDLSTTSMVPDGLSSTFADNIGPDDTVVYARGPLALSSAATGPPGAPDNFDILINLTTPFLYDPTAGNLLLDVRNFGAGSTTQMNAEDTFGDGISSVYTFTGDVNSAVGDQNNSLGLVAQFTFMPAAVPEPGALVFLAGATVFSLGLALRARHRRR